MSHPARGVCRDLGRGGAPGTGVVPKPEMKTQRPIPRSPAHTPLQPILGALGGDEKTGLASEFSFEGLPATLVTCPSWEEAQAPSRDPAVRRKVGGERKDRGTCPPQPDIAELHVPRAPTPGQPDSGERF